MKGEENFSKAKRAYERDQDIDSREIKKQKYDKIPSKYCDIRSILGHGDCLYTNIDKIPDGLQVLLSTQYDDYPGYNNLEKLMIKNGNITSERRIVNFKEFIENILEINEGENLSLPKTTFRQCDLLLANSLNPYMTEFHKSELKITKSTCKLPVFLLNYYNYRHLKDEEKYKKILITDRLRNFVDEFNNMETRSIN